MDQSQTECYLALGRVPQARGRAAGKDQLLRRGTPQMALAEVGGATVWRTGLRLLRLADILGSQCLYASHYSMEPRQVADIGIFCPCRRGNACIYRMMEQQLQTMYACKVMPQWEKHI